MTNHQIREGELKDAETIIDFNQKMAWETEKKQLNEDIIGPGVKAILTDPQKGFYLLYEKEGELLGQLMITYEWSDWRNNTIWWIQSVYVHADHRKEGIYTSLYNEVCKMAKTNGIQTIRLYVEKENFVAQKVYQRHGMSETHYDMYEITLP